MTVTTITQLVELIENRLGFTFNLEDGEPLWKQKQREVGKIKRMMKTNPKLYTLANAELAVEYSWRNRLPIKHPVTVMYRIERALEEAATPERTTPVLTSVREAVNWELAHESSASEEWIGRLLRASGDGALAALQDWKAAGRG